MLEALGRRTRRALFTYRATLAAGFASSLVALASGCQDQLGGADQGTGAYVGYAELSVGERLLAELERSATSLAERVVPTANWNGATQIPELKA